MAVTLSALQHLSNGTVTLETAGSEVTEWRSGLAMQDYQIPHECILDYLQFAFIKTDV